MPLPQSPDMRLLNGGKTLAFRGCDYPLSPYYPCLVPFGEMNFGNLAQAYSYVKLGHMLNGEQLRLVVKSLNPLELNKLRLFLSQCILAKRLKRSLMFTLFEIVEENCPEFAAILKEFEESRLFNVEIRFEDPDLTFGTGRNPQEIEAIFSSGSATVGKEKAVKKNRYGDLLAAFLQQRVGARSQAKGKCAQRVLSGVEQPLVGSVMFLERSFSPYSAFFLSGKPILVVHDTTLADFVSLTDRTELCGMAEFASVQSEKLASGYYGLLVLVLSRSLNGGGREIEFANEANKLATSVKTLTIRATVPREPGIQFTFGCPDILVEERQKEMFCLTIEKLRQLELPFNGSGKIAMEGKILISCFLAEVAPFLDIDCGATGEDMWAFMQKLGLDEHKQKSVEQRGRKAKRKARREREEVERLEAKKVLGSLALSSAAASASATSGGFPTVQASQTVTSRAEESCFVLRESELSFSLSQPPPNLSQPPPSVLPGSGFPKSAQTTPSLAASERLLALTEVRDHRQSVLNEPQPKKPRGQPVIPDFITCNAPGRFERSTLPGANSAQSYLPSTAGSYHSPALSTIGAAYQPKARSNGGQGVFAGQTSSVSQDYASVFALPGSRGFSSASSSGTGYGLQPGSITGSTPGSLLSNPGSLGINVSPFASNANSSPSILELAARALSAKGAPTSAENTLAQMQHAAMLAYYPTGSSGYLLPPR